MCTAPPKTSPSETPAGADGPRGGFTLLELMLALAILALSAGLMYLTFGAATTAWRRGMSLSEDLHHGDFVIEQLALALRSAYYPEVGRTRARASREEPSRYGFWHEDEGEGPYSSDRISWVKLGGSLVGRHVGFADTPHRIRFAVEADDDGREAVTVRAWPLHWDVEDFDAESSVEPVYLSRRVTGFDCRCAGPIEEGDEPEWEDAWEETNRLPAFVQITLYLRPLEEGDEPVEVKRLVTIPMVAQTPF